MSLESHQHMDCKKFSSVFFLNLFKIENFGTVEQCKVVAWWNRWEITEDGYYVRKMRRGEKRVIGT